jgi:competence protein ComEC
MLLPMLVVYFHRLSISSFVLNIGVSVMMATMAITAIVGLVIAQVNSTLASIVIELTNILNWVMVHSVDPFVKLRIASLRLPEYAGLTSVIYCFYYIPIIMLASLLHHWNPLSLSGKTNHRFRFIGRAVFIGQVCVIVVIVAHPFSAGSPSGKLDIDFLDVGQGDSALITFPDNTTLLVDGGGRPGPFEASESSDENFEQETRSIGEAVVSEYLWWRGLDHVDYILATHADADHIDGLNDVARNFHVRAALVARTPTADQEYAKFSETLAKERIPIQTIAEGDVLRFAESDIAVLWPPAIANPNSPSRNNDSIVLRLKFRNRTFLLMGDIEAAAENAILRRQEDLEADVVKVPHHGSRTSSTEAFVRAAGSQFAVVSVGQTSIFGHPHQDVVDRWRVSGAKVLTTGKSGTITFSTDGSELNVATFVNSR